MVYGETGRGVILNHIKCLMIGFWLRLVKGKETKHSCTNFKISFAFTRRHTLSVKIAMVEDYRKYF